MIEQVRDGVTLHRGNCCVVMPNMPEASVDAIVTDPPYDLTNRTPDVLGCIECGRTIGGKDGSTPSCPRCGGELTRQRSAQRKGFMGKDWDATGVAFDPATWIEALRVAKPGAHLLAFGGTRTFHRMTVAIEDAGWEVRDCLSWLYGSGFPKSLNVGDGRGTALKPGWEPIVLARKPLSGTVAATVAEYGTGALNIDACRVDGRPRTTHANGNRSADSIYGNGMSDRYSYEGPSGRWPANVVLDEDAAGQLDATTGTLTSGLFKGHRNSDKTRGVYGAFRGDSTKETETYGDSGGASRFFYCAKAGQAERPTGEQTHPTVKPLSLMRWLVRMVTPPGGLVLDPFAGTGTTAEAALLEGAEAVLIERHEPYHELIRQRLAKPLQAGLFGGDAA